MKKIWTVFAVFAGLLPAWGQNSAVTINGARVGLEADGTTSRTTLWWINPDQKTFSQKPTITFVDASGNWYQVGLTLATGKSMLAVQLGGGPLAEGSAVYYLFGKTPTTPATTFALQVAAPGDIVFAMVDHLDQNGNVIGSKVLTDGSYLAPVIATQFALGMVVGDPATEVSVMLANPGDSDATVTFEGYDDGWDNMRPPFATTTVKVPAHGRFIGLASQVLGADYVAFVKNFMATYGVPMPDGYLALASDQPIQATATLMRSVGVNGPAVQTAWNAFPTVPDPKLYGVQGFANGSYSAKLVSGGCAILYGTFAASGNTVLMNGKPLDASQVLFESAGQINVSLGTLNSSTATFAVSSAHGVSNALAPASN